MSKALTFRKGDFITQNTCPDSFAIFGGDVYEPTGDEIGEDYSLICYYNPNHFTQDSNGKWIRESVFEYDLGEEETCEYTINSEDLSFWRTCTPSEKDKALKILADKKRLAWEEIQVKFRKLATNECLKFGDPKSTGTCGGNVIHNGQSTSPMYGGGQTPLASAKNITRLVKDDWEQKMPICTITNERREFVSIQCNKLINSFSSYSHTTGNVRVYPQNGAQVPRREHFFDYCGYGMCAYNALMNGEMWGAYDDDY